MATCKNVRTQYIFLLFRPSILKIAHLTTLATHAGKYYGDLFYALYQLVFFFFFLSLTDTCTHISIYNLIDQGTSTHVMRFIHRNLY